MQVALIVSRCRTPNRRMSKLICAEGALTNAAARRNEYEPVSEGRDKTEKWATEKMGRG